MEILLKNNSIYDFEIVNWLVYGGTAMKNVSNFDFNQFNGTRDILLLINACFSGAFDSKLGSVSNNPNTPKDESKQQSKHDDQDDRVLQIMKELKLESYKKMMASINVIAACQKNQESNCLLISPFWEMVEAAFNDKKLYQNHEKRMTPKMLYQSVLKQTKTKKFLDNTMPLIGSNPHECLNQLSSQPLTAGTYANEFDLCPIVKHYI